MEPPPPPEVDFLATFRFPEETTFGFLVHLGQCHFPLGLAVRFKQRKWNHSVGQSPLSHLIILPCSPPLQVHHSRFLLLGALRLGTSVPLAFSVDLLFLPPMSKYPTWNNAIF